MDATRVLVPLLLLTDGLATGVMLATVIGLAPYQLALPYQSYVGAIQFLWKRYDPMMPIMNVLALLCDIGLVAVTEERSARTLFGLAGLLLLVVMVVSVVKNVPINRFVMSLDPQHEPADWARLDPRVRWRNWNLFRTTLAVGALVLNLVAVAALI